MICVPLSARAAGATVTDIHTHTSARISLRFTLTPSLRGAIMPHPPRATQRFSPMQPSVHQTENALFLILLQLIVMIGAARVFNTAFRAMRQPGRHRRDRRRASVRALPLGYFFPDWSRTLFGASTSLPITIISQIGLILLMFQIGSDFEFSHLLANRNRRGMIAIALVSICAPLILGFTIGHFSAPHLAPTTDSVDLQPLFSHRACHYRGTDPRTYPARVWIDAHTHRSRRHLRRRRQRCRRLDPARGRLCLRRGAVLTHEPHPAGGRACCCFISTKTSFRPGAAKPASSSWCSFCPCSSPSPACARMCWVSRRARIRMARRAILATAIVAKIVPVYMAGRWAGFDARESTILGVLMNTRALMELIVLNIGFDLGFVLRRSSRCSSSWRS